jgi:hypothetical protein
MTLVECKDVYLPLSKKNFTPRRSKHGLFGGRKDFLQANSKFDSNVLQDAIRKKWLDDVLSKDLDLAYSV